MLRQDKHYWLMIAATAVFPATYGAEKHDSHVLPEVVVSADPLGDVDAHIVQPLDVLGEDELLRRNARSIGETVSQELGVSSTDFGPAVGRPIIRGLTGSRVRVLEDGIGTMDVSTVSADHAVATETVFAEQVELFRGPATLLYGSGASGGLVNVVNNRILDHVPDTVEGEVYAHYDSVADGLLGAFELDAGAGNFAVHIDGMKRDSDDYDIPGFASIAPKAGETSGTLANSDSATEGYSAGTSLIGDNAFIGVVVSYLDNQYGVPSEQPVEEAVRIEQEQTRIDFKAALNKPLPYLRKIKTRWGYNDHEHIELEGAAVGTVLTNKEYEGRVELIHEAFGAWGGVVGIQYRNRDFSASGEEAFIPSSDLESIAVFIFEKGDMGALHFDAGLRYEHQDAAASAISAIPEHDLFSVSGGTTWDYRDGYELGFAVSRSQRAPSLEELFANGPHMASRTFEIGNVALERETSVNFDVYWRKVSGRLTMQANVFYNQIDAFVFLRENDLNRDDVADYVAEDFAGDPADIFTSGAGDNLLLVNYVQGDAHFWGFELEARYRLMDNRHGTLDGRLWTDSVKGELDDGGDLPRITPPRYGVTMEWNRATWYAIIDVMRVAEQDNTAALESKTSGYTLMTLNAGYTRNFAGADVTLFSRLTNVLDEEARRHTSFLKDSAPLPGVSAVLGLRARF